MLFLLLRIDSICLNFDVFILLVYSHIPDVFVRIAAELVQINYFADNRL